MGFKDLSKFNEALLAKLTWRLLHDKTSLFYWVFKVKYFQHCSVMEETNPSSASYAWKSVLRGREVISRRGIWRIGDGRSTAIWGERWLPVKHSPKILSPCVAALSDAKGSIFIDQQHRTWKTDVTDSTLLSFEANMIKKIPLSHMDQPDELTWPFNPRGEYSVKSGYKFLQQEVQNLLPAQSATDLLQPLWQSV